jgi:hypothetical protein
MYFLSYVNAVRKHWWALMGCAAFTILSGWIAYADKTNAWTIRTTIGFAGVFLFYAGYLAWRDEHRRVLAIEEGLRVTSAHWKELASYARDNCSTSYVDCVWTCDTDHEWRVSGGNQPEACRAWIFRAGAMLLQSKNVRDEMSDEIKKEPNDLARWCLYLKSKGTYRTRSNGSVYVNGITTQHFTAEIENFWNLSYEICMKFSLKEFAPQDSN